MPGPLSRTQISSGSATGSALGVVRKRTPRRYAVVRVISPSMLSLPMASAAFFTRFRNTWIS